MSHSNLPRAASTDSFMLESPCLSLKNVFKTQLLNGILLHEKLLSLFLVLMKTDYRIMITMLSVKIYLYFYNKSKIFNNHPVNDMFLMFSLKMYSLGSSLFLKIFW